MSQFINIDKINVGVKLDIKKFDYLVTNTKATGPDGKPMVGGQTIIDRARERYPNNK